MGQNGVRGGTDEASQVQDVHVDLAGASDERRRAAAEPLDLLDRPEEAFRGTAPEDLRGGVPEPGLLAVADRIGAVEGGDAPKGRPLRQVGERPE